MFTGSCRCCLHQSAIAFSPLRSRLAIVFTCTVNPPFRLRAHRCLKPRKSKVAGFLPCFFAFLADNASPNVKEKSPVPFPKLETYPGDGAFLVLIDGGRSKSAFSPS